MKIALQHDYSTIRSAKFWTGLLNDYTSKIAQIREALSGAAGAALTRGSKRVRVWNAEGKLVRTRLVGAPDASQTVGRITSEHDEDVPVDAFKSDLARKKSLRQVMGNPNDESEEEGDTRRHDLRSGEGILGDVLGKILDDGEKCYDDDGNEIDCETGEPIEEVKRTMKRSATVAESAINTFREMYGGMAQTFGPPSEAPEALDGQDLGKYLDGKGKKLPPDDPKVDLRYSGSQPPVPGARCGSCVYFNADMSSCKIVSNPVTPALVCSMWTPSSEGEGAALQTFEDEMQ